VAATAALLLPSSLGQSWVVEQGFAGQVVYLAAGALLGGGVFLVAAYVLKVGEIRGLWEQGLAWLRGRAR
jgi:hypothetical protein